MAKTYGSRERGLDGVPYDSAQEAEVARQLDAMVRERVVRGYMPHVKLGGTDVDFLVQLGKAAGKGHDRRLIALEYDGLGEERRRDLAPKAVRLGLMTYVGVELRWLLYPTYDALKECLTDYQAPTFLRKTRVCPHCGFEESMHVIARNEKNKGLRSLIQHRPCRACSKMLKFGPLPDFRDSQP